MEEGGEGGGDDRTEKFHHKEAISAVNSDFLGEEEDGYDDLCSDVNASEGSLQSSRKKNDDLGFSNRNEELPPKLGGGNVNIGGGTILCVGDLHWWTTDAELEAELGKYGPVKEVKFLEDEETGKSKGSCHVEFYDPAAAMACKENMNGHVFNGRPCVVSYAASPNSSVKKTGGSNAVAGGNYQGGDDARGMGNRGPAGPTTNIGPGGGFGQGIGSTLPQYWWFNAPMGRMGTYGGFYGAPRPPFSGFQSAFPPLGGIGLHGVAPYNINPGHFYNRMPMNSMGGMMMPRGGGVEGRNMGMWSAPSIGGSRGEEEHGGGRAVKPSLGEEAASGHHDRGGGGGGGGLQNTDASERRIDRDMPRDQDVGLDDHDSTKRRHGDDRDVARERDRERGRPRERDRDRERDRYREDRRRYPDHNRHRDRDPHRTRSRDADYGNRRRPASN